ncbi:calpain-11-like [Ambystoma mexicanum]|uniref:calpain-11-like n=1 Tax=Ambystoma mexicanum TaxID=8296 RepID=UPI0037E768AF
MANTKAELGSREQPLRYRNQDYEALRSACLQEKRLFEDPEFPAEPESLGAFAIGAKASKITWLRPKDLIKNPEFILESADTTDICQGELGNCWFLAAMSSLTLEPKLFSYVVPEKQDFLEDYAGIFRFRFWQFGKWVEVVVDDRLPTKQKKLVYTRSASRNEFWSALLEKAYAKINCSYSSLNGGNVSEAMEDFTGGIAESIDVSSEPPEELWKAVNKALEKKPLVSCFIKVSNPKDIGQANKVGLVMGHAYALIATHVVQKGNDTVHLIRVRNPWGFVEYSGPWSDKSAEWTSFSGDERKQLKLDLKEDGEFWISCDAFSEYFTSIEVCRLNPELLDDRDSSWIITTHEGSWVPGSSAGGNTKLKTFFTNPQFQLVLKEEEEDEATEDTNSCTAVVELLQKSPRKEGCINFLYIAFHIFSKKGSALNRAFFTKNRPISDTGNHRNNRAVARRLCLPPGDYVIMPSTHLQNLEGNFYLRIFTKEKNEFREHGNFASSYTYIQPVMSAPPGFTSHLRDCFFQKAAEDNTLNSLQFQDLINSVFSEPRLHLTLETCRSLVFGVKTQSPGKLTLEETEPIVKWIQAMEDIYKAYSKDAEDPLSSFELPLALEEAGFELSNHVSQQLWLRYRTSDNTLTFSEFANCVSKLRKLFEIYNRDMQDIPPTQRRDINQWLVQFLAI